MAATRNFRRTRARLLAAAACALAATGALWTFPPKVGAQQRDAVVIAAGERTQVYYAAAQAIKEAMERANPGLAVRVLETKGSVQNVSYLQSGQADFAIVQNDVLFYAFHGTEDFLPHEKLRSVISLFPESVHVLAPANSAAESILDLESGSVGVGPSGSGSSVNARQVLSTLPNGELLKLEYLNLENSLAKMAEGELDAVMTTGAAPIPLVSEALASGKVKLIGIPHEAAVRIGEEFPYFSEGAISYADVREGAEVPSVSVTAVLATREDLPRSLAAKCLSALLSPSGQEILLEAHPALASFGKENAIGGLTIYIHQGAKQYYYREGIIPRSYSTLWFAGTVTVVLLSVGLIAIFLLLRGRKPSMKGAELRPWVKLAIKWIPKLKHLIAALLVVSLIVLVAQVIQLAEDQYAMKTPGAFVQPYNSIQKTVAWLIVLAGTGYEDDLFPQSPVGKIAAASVMLIGIGGILLIFGSLFTETLIAALKGGSRMKPDDWKNHLIICGKPRHLPEILRQLTHSDTRHSGGAKVVVLTEKDMTEELADFRMGLVSHVKGSPSVSQDLLKAGIRGASSAIIFGDPSDPDSDSRTVLTVLSIESVCREQKGCDSIYTIAEIIHAENAEHARRAGADEVILVEAISEKLAVASALHHGITKFVNEILTFTDKGGQEVYQLSLQSAPGLVGKTFDELLALCRQHGVLLMAVERDIPEEPKLLVNPPPGGQYRTKADDSLFVLAKSREVLLGIR